MSSEIIAYYDGIAAQYDDSRFANSYGKFIDAQERTLLRKLLGKNNNYKVLDMGCGTGRLLNFADEGIDASEEMIKIAANKFPHKNITKANSAHTHFEPGTFDVIFSFHVFMHLNRETVKDILAEAYRILKPGGRLIFDVPSKNRRKLLNFKSAAWHGANDFSVNEIRGFCNDKWKLESYNGIMFLPVHRLPSFSRKWLVKFDDLLNNSVLKKYSSYIAFELRKV